MIRSALTRVTVAWHARHRVHRAGSGGHALHGHCSRRTAIRPIDREAHRRGRHRGLRVRAPGVDNVVAGPVPAEQHADGVVLVVAGRQPAHLPVSGRRHSEARLSAELGVEAVRPPHGRRLTGGCEQAVEVRRAIGAGPAGEVGLLHAVVLERGEEADRPAGQGMGIGRVVLVDHDRVADDGARMLLHHGLGHRDVVVDVGHCRPHVAR